MQIITAVIVFTLLVILPAPVQAAPNVCRKAYEDAAENYWYIIGDMVRLKALFDNYNDLCRKHYPDEIAKLQPDADTLRDQVARDMTNVTPVMTTIFDTELTAIVPKSCTKDKKSRDTIRRAFLADIKRQSKTMGARMKKSGKTVSNPESSLKLCRDLGAYAPFIRKKLGPNLSTPLLTMSELNRQYMVKDGSKLKDAFATYRKTLATLPVKK